MNAKLLLSAILIFSAFFCNAQMDDKFYQPSKELKPLEFSNAEFISFPVENDTITAYFLKTKTVNPKATILFFHGAAGNATTYQCIT
jgi:hypothetical protein